MGNLMLADSVKESDDNAREQLLLRERELS